MIVANKIKYKETGVDFVPVIPENWNFLKLRHIGSLYSGLSGKSGKDFQIENSKNRYVPFTSISNDIVVNLEKLSFVKINDGENQNLVVKNDILFLMSSETQDDIGKAAIVLNDIQNVYLNSFCKGFRINDEKIDPKFLIYALNSENYRNHFKIEGKGFTRINLKQYAIKNLAIAFPPFQTQQQIAGFLDYKCEQINRFINNKIEFVSILKEQRQSVIDELLDFDNSNSKKARLKNLVTINGLTLKEDTPKNFKIKYIDIANVNSNGIIDIVQELNFSKAPSRARRIVKKNDILISTVRTYLRAITIIDSEEENLIASTGFAVLSDSEIILPELLIELLRTEKFIHKVISNSKGVSYPAISSTELGCLEVSYPKERKIQIELVKKIKEETKSIDELISKAEKEIILIKEYKESLISHAVTGQLQNVNYKK